MAPPDLLFVIPRKGLIAGLVTAQLAAKIRHEGDHVVARYVRTTSPADTSVQGDRSGLWHYQHQAPA